MAKIQGYILAGGKSQRFGADKARVSLHGEHLIERTLRLMSELNLASTIVADRLERYSDLKAPVIIDERPDHGPLSGVAAALSHCPADSWAFVVSCDLKSLNAQWLDLLKAQISDTHDAIAFRDNNWQPFVALYNPRLLPTVRSHLDRQELSLQKLLDQSSVRSLELPHDWISPPSINTPEDLDVLRSQEPSHEHRP